MTERVLDTWAVVAWLKDEPAAAHVGQLLDGVTRREHRLVMNIVNLGEVFYVVAKLKNLALAERVADSLRSRISVVSATDDLVMHAAGLKARHKIAYADAFAASTAMIRHVPLVTGDPELKNLSAHEKNLQLEWIAS